MHDSIIDARQSTGQEGRRPVRVSPRRSSLHPPLGTGPGEPPPAAVPAVVRRAAVRVAGVIAALGVLGVVAVVQAPAWRRFHLDAEYTVPSAFSALLLAGCGLCALLLAARGGRFRWVTVALAVYFVFMGLDEAFILHERVEAALRVDWQLLYAPLILAGGLGFLHVYTLLRRSRGTSGVWIAGAVAWAAAQGLEWRQWSGDVKRAGYDAMMVTEELLEMTGTALWLLALAVAVSLLPPTGRPAVVRATGRPADALLRPAP